MIDHAGIGVVLVARSAIFYDAALAALGPKGYYAAFVLDPDGNNFEAVYRGD